MQRIGKQIKRWGRNRNVILILAVALGLTAYQAAHWFKGIVLPLLGVVMTLSTLNVTGEIFQSPKILLRNALGGISMTYLIHSSVILASAVLVVDTPDIWKGFVLIAAVPPAVAVIPYTEILGGDRGYSLIATAGCYLSALAMMPLMTLSLIGPGFFDPLKLLSAVLQLILIPFLLSRLLLRIKMAGRLAPVRGTITNWCFFVIIYTIIGTNSDMLWRNPLSLIPAAGVAAAGTFLIGAMTGWILNRCRIGTRRATSLVLLCTQKNCGLAGGIALTFFNERTAIPAAVCTIFMITYFIWLNASRRAPSAANNSGSSRIPGQ